MRGRNLFLVSLAVAALLGVALTFRQGTSSPVDAQGLNVSVSLSRPANGAFLATGERATVTVTLNDKAGAALTRDAFATLNLYMYGPQETTKTVTAAMLNAEMDRSKTPHHYINLLNDPNVQVSGSTLRYTLKGVSTEEPGTYVATVYAVRTGTPSRETQMFAFADFQVGTAMVEKQIVEKENCAACHQGASNGQLYFYHADPGRSPFGSTAIDNGAIKSCKACHNNNGYAGYPGNIDNPDGPSTARTPDHIVLRVHGVHMGKSLKNTFNTTPKTGNFKYYTDIIFPADVKNCTACHVDDRWKTQPSRLACGACHDATWFGEAASMPNTFKAHSGGPQANDAGCAACHPADSGGVKSVAEAHKVSAPAFKHNVELSMSAPANGKFYVAGEKPTVTITIKDAATGQPIDPKTMAEPADSAKVQTNEWRRANLFVSGPRSDTRPVLTTAKADVTKTYANNELRVLNDMSKADPRITRTATSIVYQLDDVNGLQPGTYTAFVETMPAAPLGGWGVVNFQVGTATPEKPVATNCTQCHADTRMHASYFAVQFNPDICKNCHDYDRQMEGKTGWGQSNNGFGAGPLARRVHGVHRGAYLDKPKEVHAQYDYSKVIFPQDIRNCAKCHDSTTATAAWQENPSRLACLGCHDTDLAIAHGSRMTEFAASGDRWSPDRVETCKVCHGAGRDFAVEKMHNIADPYKPPYSRRP